MAQANAPDGALQVPRIEPAERSFFSSILGFLPEWVPWFATSTTKDTTQQPTPSPSPSPTREYTARPPSRPRAGAKRSSDDEDSALPKRRRNITPEPTLPTPKATPSTKLLAEPDALPYYPTKAKPRAQSGHDIYNNTIRLRDRQLGYPQLNAHAARRNNRSRPVNPDLLYSLKKPKQPALSRAQREKEEEVKRRRDLAKILEKRGRDAALGDKKRNALRFAHIWEEADSGQFQTLDQLRTQKIQRELKISEILAVKPKADILPDEPLPVLSDEEHRLVERVLRNPNSAKIPALPFFNNFTLNARDISFLAPREWLNDNVMDYYLALVCHRANKDSPKHKKVHAFSTFFYKNLSSGGHNSVRRWAKRFGIEGAKLGKLDYLIVPINQNNSHWTLAVVNFKKKAFEYYDSLGGSMNVVFEHLRAYVAAESQGTVDLTSWKNITHGKKGPQQANGFDCGVFVCKTAEVVSRNRLPVFEGKDGVQLRYMMLLDIMKGQLPDVPSS